MHAIQGPNEITYGFAVTPVGLRAVLRPAHRVQPTFALNTGFIVSQRAIPIDGAASFNFQVLFGPGVQIFTSKQSSFRMEYLLRHISNGGSANLNPGIDQGIFRISFTYHR
ncbi:acyloxyacyl hydrolase [Terracidiphilus sp.]|uniref:acyloxyacyl hydrolase n=1 Tax=Terracidiphilus sp. TaxID=1964191 RepID=UPI003C717ABC